MSKVYIIVNNPAARIDLSALLDSVCEQRYPDIEVIVPEGEMNPGDFTSETVQGQKARLGGRGCGVTLSNHRNRDLGPIFSQGSTAGKYLCFPDAKSIMAPEFISEMVAFLESNPEYGAVRCNGAIVDALDPSFHIARLVDTSSPHEGMILESLIARETPVDACLWMIRMEACAGLNICGGMSREIAARHWSLALPLSNRTKVGFIDKDLVRIVRNGDDPMRKILTHYDDRIRFEGSFSSGCLDTIDGLDGSAEQKDRWRKLAELASIKAGINIESTFRLWMNFRKCRDLLAVVVKNCGGDPSTLVPENGEKAGFEGDEPASRTENALGILTYFYADLLQQVLLGRISKENSRRILNEGFGIFRRLSSIDHIHMYGAGAGARVVLPIFLALGLRPRSIWDRAARPDQHMFGVPVIQPPFSQVPQPEREKIEIVVCLGHRSSAEQVRRALHESGLKNVVHVSEVQGARAFLKKRVLSSLDWKPLL